MRSSPDVGQTSPHLVCLMVELGVVLVNLRFLSEFEVPEGRKIRNRELQLSSKDSLDNIVDTKVFPPLLSIQEHRLDSFIVKLPCSAEPGVIETRMIRWG